MQENDKPKLLSKIILIILVAIIGLGMIVEPRQRPYNDLGESYISADTQDTIGSVGSHIRGNSIEYINSPLFISGITLASLSDDIVTEEMQLVINCESSGDHSKIGDTNYYKDGNLSPSYGIAQFQKGTFEWFKKLSGYNNLDIGNEEDQLILMRWAFDNGYAYHWSCWKNI